MVIQELHLVLSSFGPNKAYPELVVHTDRPLPDSVAGQPVQAVSWRRPQIIYPTGGIQLRETPAHRLDQIRRKPLRADTGEDILGRLCFPSLDHGEQPATQAVVARGATGRKIFFGGSVRLPRPSAGRLAAPDVLAAKPFGLFVYDRHGRFWRGVSRITLCHSGLRAYVERAKVFWFLFSKKNTAFLCRITPRQADSPRRRGRRG